MSHTATPGAPSLSLRFLERQGGGFDRDFAHVGRKLLSARLDLDFDSDPDFDRVERALLPACL
jgi:hypothetical protein